LNHFLKLFRKCINFIFIAFVMPVSKIEAFPEGKAGAKRVVQKKRGKAL
jgi:hypothetical protein